ncbi:MAG: hypothetical protein ACKOYM_03900, partial [Actinomycetes bacterium]
MSLRTKMVGAIVGLTALAAGSIGLLALRAADRSLAAEIDRSVVASSVELARRTGTRLERTGRPDRRTFGDPPPPVNVPGFDQVGEDQRVGLLRLQLLRPNGRVVGAASVEPLPVTAVDLGLAASAE